MGKTYLGFPYVINFCNLTQTRINTGFIRNIRRVQQAPYPLIKVRLEELTPSVHNKQPDIKTTKHVARADLKPESEANGRSSSNSQSNKKQSSKKGSRNRGKQNVDSTVNIARSILNNLNIFGKFVYLNKWILLDVFKFLFLRYKNFPWVSVRKGNFRCGFEQY